jgi:hypothetical protein
MTNLLKVIPDDLKEKVLKNFFNHLTERFKLPFYEDRNRSLQLYDSNNRFIMECDTKEFADFIIKFSSQYYLQSKQENSKLIKELGLKNVLEEILQNNINADFVDPYPDHIMD